MLCTGSHSTLNQCRTSAEYNAVRWSAMSHAVKVEEWVDIKLCYAYSVANGRDLHRVVERAWRGQKSRFPRLCTIRLAIGQMQAARCSARETCTNQVLLIATSMY